MVLENKHTIAKQITDLKKELTALNMKREELKNKIAQLQNSLATGIKIADPTVAYLRLCGFACADAFKDV